MRKTKDTRDWDKLDHKDKAFRKIEKRRFDDEVSDEELRLIMGTPAASARWRELIG